MQLSQPVYRAYRLKPSLALAPPNPLARQPSRPSPLMGRGSSLLSLNSTIVGQLAPPLLLPQPGWRVTVFFPCVLEDPFAEDIKVQALEEALGDGGSGAAMARSRSATSGHTSADAGGASSTSGSGGAGGTAGGPDGGGAGSLLRRSHGFLWRELRESDGAAFSVLVQPEVSRHALVRLTDANDAEIGQGVICLRHAFLTSTSAAAASPAPAEGAAGEGRGRLGGRFGLPRLMGGGGRRRPGGGGVAEGVEVLLTEGGRAVASLRLQVKIRRHKT